MWFHYLKIGSVTMPTIRKLSTMSEYELWHHRLGHPNDRVLTTMHKYARGIPKLRPPDFYSCESCNLGKLKKDASTKSKMSLKDDIKPHEKLHPGQHLHMDLGFVRGSAYSIKNEKGQTVTSLDGFRGYLIIVD